MSLGFQRQYTRITTQRNPIMYKVNKTAKTKMWHQIRNRLPKKMLKVQFQRISQKLFYFQGHIL